MNELQLKLCDIQGRLFELSAVKKLVERHEPLRTSFEMIDGECVQIINNVDNLPVTFTEAVCETDEDLNKLINDFVKPFDLAQAPLFRFNLVDIGENRQLLLFDVHHIIADGTAVEILTRDFNTLYFGELSPLGIQYKDFINMVWYRKTINIKQDGNRVFLCFGAADHLTTVLVNGKCAGRHKGGNIIHHQFLPLPSPMMTLTAL